MTLSLVQLFKDSIDSANEDICLAVEGESLFLRYDSIHVKQTPGAAVVEFYWRKKLVYTIEADDVDLSSGEQMMISGIDGRMPISVSRIH